MKVDGVNPHSAHGRGIEKPNHEDKKVKKAAEEVSGDNELGEGLAAGTEGSTEGSDSSEKVRGVIRLLGEGHFKGVADVRLRINFFDELETLPELSEPSGKGAAYEKFLAMYNELQGVETAGEELDDAEPLDSLL